MINIREILKVLLNFKYLFSRIKGYGTTYYCLDTIPPGMGSSGS